VVYATCTYAPEENEMVIEDVLETLQSKMAVRIVHPVLPDIAFSPGLTSWKRATLRDDMANAVRIYPHQNNTGGFFFALLEKDRDCNPGYALAARQTALEEKQHYPDFDLAGYLNDLERRFGISRDCFDRLEFRRQNMKTIAVMPTLATATRPEPHCQGLPFVHVNMRFPKLTTAAAMTWGQYAVKHVINASSRQMDAFLSGRDFIALAERIDGFESPGYVIVKQDDISVGVGLCRASPAGLAVKSLFPKAWRTQSLENAAV
jgi:hypothetical protein